MPKKALSSEVRKPPSTAGKAKAPQPKKKPSEVCIDGHNENSHCHEVDSLPELEPTALPPESEFSKQKRLEQQAKLQEKEFIASTLADENANTIANEVFDLGVIDHSNFADQFIQEVEYNPETVFLKKPEADGKQSSCSFKTSENVTSKSELREDRRKGNIVHEVMSPCQDSLKLVYSNPAWPHLPLLAKKLDKLSSLRNLMLDGSNLQSLRDLGSCLSNLITLSVARCGLQYLDGTIALPNLENLFAADNTIRSPAPLAFLSKLKYVDLSGNNICSLESFQYLGLCGQLRCMKLTDTEVAQMPNFQTYLKQTIPSLRDLRPKISTIHGDDLYSAEETETSDETTVEYFDDLRENNFSYFFGTSSSTELPSSSTDIATPDSY